PRRVGDVGCVEAAAGELPEEPAVDGAEYETVAPVLAQKPLELRRGEVRVGDESGALAEERDVELAAALGRPPVLPHDRARDRCAGATVPEDGRLALVRDRDRVDAVEPGGARGGDHALPDLLGVVLDPAGSREVLRQLRVAAANDVQPLVDDKA